MGQIMEEIRIVRFKAAHTDWTWKKLIQELAAVGHAVCRRGFAKGSGLFI